MVKGGDCEIFKLNFPSISVAVPIVEPTTETIAPIMGSPVCLSRRMPEISWAESLPKHKRSKKKDSITLFIQGITEVFLNRNRV